MHNIYTIMSAAGERPLYYRSTKHDEYHRLKTGIIGIPVSLPF